jgi:hypothetical protein
MSSFLSRRSGDPKNPVKKFTKAHRRALEEFADLKISLEELRRRLAGVVEFDFREHERRLDCHYGTPVPGVRIELRHIRAAMEKQARGEISTEELADWATMLQMNQAYDWEGPEEEEIADWLNEISMLTLKAKPQGE